MEVRAINRDIFLIIYIIIFIIMIYTNFKNGPPDIGG